MGEEYRLVLYPVISESQCKEKMSFKNRPSLVSRIKMTQKMRKFRRHHEDSFILHPDLQV